jgi:ABC-2 type transport system ATP-binding protein
MMGFLKPTFGTGWIGGLSVQKQNLDIRAISGHLSGEVRFFNHLTGYAHLKLLADLREIDCRKRAEELASVLDLDLKIKIRYYSRGMRQKLGIIQAMMHDPEILILDEPTNSLDPLMQQKVYDLLSQFSASSGTVFFSSHIINEVERICSRVAIIRAGRLVAENSVDELRAKSVQHISMVLCPETELSEPLPEGFQIISRDGRKIHLLVSGDAKQILNYLHAQSVEFITIEPPSLEEVFMKFYTETAPSPHAPETLLMPKRFFKKAARL